MNKITVYFSPNFEFKNFLPQHPCEKRDNKIQSSYLRRSKDSEVGGVCSMNGGGERSPDCYSETISGKEMTWKIFVAGKIILI